MLKKQKQARLRTVLERIKALQLLTEPTEAESTELSDLITEGENLNTEIGRLDEEEKRAARLLASASTTANPLPTGGNNPGEPNRRAIELPATARRKTRAFETPQQAFAFGQFVRASVLKIESAQEWCREHGYALVKQARAQTEGENTAGGYLVPTEFGEIISALIADYGIARQYCTISKMTRDTKNHPKRPMLLRMRPGAELRTMAKDTVSFGNIELVAKKAYLLLELSSELSEDAVVDVADELAMVIAESAAYTEDDCLWNGDGTSTYFGIWGVLPKMLGIANNVSVIAAGAGIDTFAEITRANLLSVMAAVPTAALTNGDPAWYVSNAASIGALLRLALEAGGATAAEIVAGNAPKILGYPVRVSNALLATQADQAAALAFGSLKKAVVFGDRRELTIVSSTEAGFLTDSEMIRATERFDIVVHEPGSANAAEAGALALLKFGA